MFELSASDAALWGFGFTVIGALVGALAAVYSARITAYRQHLYEESAKFRSSFVEELIVLRHANEDAFKVISEGVLAKHQKAKVLFEPWVPKRQRSAFDSAWNEYSQSLNTVAPGSLINRKSECSASLARLEKLLAFARHDS
jgi:hypothetical protein